MLVEDVVTRLDTAIEALHSRVKGAIDFSEMLRRKALPNYTPAAFVVHNGIAGGTAVFSTGVFQQAADEMLSVVLIIRTSGDVTGAKGQPQLHDLTWSVIFALSGWAPDAIGGADEDGTDPVGVLTLRRGRVNSLDAGTIFYQLDFAIQQQIRVLS